MLVAAKLLSVMEKLLLVLSILAISCKAFAVGEYHNRNRDKISGVALIILLKNYY